MSNQNTMTPPESAALEETVKTTGNFFIRAFIPAADTFGLIRHDNMNVRRLKNQIACLKKVRKIVEDEGLTMKQVNLKALFPLLEGIALEEGENGDETLQDMWTNLLVNYIDSSKNLASHVYPSILSQLSTHEVEILQYMMKKSGSVNVWFQGHPNEEMYYPNEELANLVRLGLIVGEGRETQGIFHEYRINSFGYAFLSACTR